MRFLITILAAGFILSSYCWGQEKYEDVVYLKNGGVMHGKIVEMIPEKSVKLQTKDGNILVFTMAEIDRIVKEAALPDTTAQEPRNKIESWYLYFALGYGKAYYPEPLQHAMDALSSVSGISHTGISIEVPGIYWPLHNNHTLLGGSINGIGDRFEAGGGWIQINQYLISFSSMQFLTGEIGDGLYLRGDLGLAWVNVQSFSGISGTSNGGVGVLFGGGYSLPVSSETRLTLNLNYGVRSVESETYGALSINLGILL